MLDRDGCIGFASSAIEELLGRDYHEVVGMHVAAMLPALPAYLEQTGLTRNKKSRSEAIGLFVTEALHANGSRVRVRVAIKRSGFGSMVPLLLLTPVS